MKFEKILLPFDGSAHSINATNYALNVAKQFRAHVTIIHCFEWHSGMPDVQDLRIKSINSDLQRAARNILKKAGEIFANQGVEYKLEIMDGSPGHVLAQLAKSKEYDLIIMGSHGHSDIEGLFLGSVTHKVLNTIYCPVLVVP
ncbi:MAG: universal stress protein [Desulfovibrionaceae bacterium]|nr:universal stress protein [Desulfovibrionaceae bacterium]